MTLRESILGSPDDSLTPRPLAVPEWNCQIFVRGMTALERDALEMSLSDGPDRYRNVRAKMAVACCCDQAGARIFEPEDVEALGRKSAVALDRIFALASQLSGLDQRDRDMAKKNGDAAAFAGSHTS